MRGFVPVLTGCLFLSLCVSTDAAAQTIGFRDGVVSLQTNGASLDKVLAEWARVGGTEIVNGERLTGPAPALSLVDVPEVQALEKLLSSVAGYIVVPRKIPQTASSSIYERILILPTSSPGPKAERKPGDSSLDNWPFPVHAGGLTYPQDDTPVVVVIEKGGAKDVPAPWPFPYNPLYVRPEDPPSASNKAEPAAPWPFPGNNSPITYPDEPVSASRPAAQTPEVPAPWPFPVNPLLSYEDRVKLEAAGGIPEGMPLDEDGRPLVPDIPLTIGLLEVPGVPIGLEHRPALTPGK